MDVVISWSKPTSRGVASSLHVWLPKVLPGIQPWMSEEDIAKGKAWFSMLQNALGQARHCIICVTRENVRSEWLYYEAGVIAAKGDGVLICPYLVGVDAGELSGGPLGQFQCTVATKDDTHRLVQSLNLALDKTHDAELLAVNFQSKWPELEKAIGVEDNTTGPASAAMRVSGTGFVMSGDGRELLLEAVRDKHGRVVQNRTRAGLTIGTNGRNFVEAHNPRSEAQWKHALDELTNEKLLEALSPKNEVFQVTKRGYDWAETLQPTISEATPMFGISNKDIISLLEEYLAQYKKQLGDKVFRFAEIDKALGLPAGSAEKCLPDAANKFGYVVARKGEQTMTFKANFTTVPRVGH